jgi:hypothetical protein
MVRQMVGFAIEWMGERTDKCLNGFVDYWKNMRTGRWINESLN